MSRRIAVIADVHANLPALKAVIRDASFRRVDEIWNLGDMVGYAPFPNETIALLRRRCSRHVLGNHDSKCADSGQVARLRAAGKDEDKVFSFEWTRRVLKPANLAFIAAMPRTDQVEVEGVTLLLKHGSSSNKHDCLTSRTAAGILQSAAAGVAADGVRMILCGHTHEFFDRTVDGVRFVNPGSIGRPFDQDARASYCILEISKDRLQVEPFRVPYSLAAVLAEMRFRGFPKRLVCAVAEARSLEAPGPFKSEEIEKCLLAAAGLARQYPSEEHARQVARLAGDVFDELNVVHGLGIREKVYLRVAALLHDIGWVQGKAGHHKVARDLILKDRTLPLDSRERALVAMIARYHRGSLPHKTHKVYQDLARHDQETVNVLAACLRMADGLDRSHRSSVERVRIIVEEREFAVEVVAREQVDIAVEIAATKGKADLLEYIFGRKVGVKETQPTFG